MNTKTIILNTGKYQGSERNFNLVKQQIHLRFGEEAAKKYDPSKNCFTFKTWQGLGYMVKKGERALKAVTTIRTSKINEDTKEELENRSFRKFINLFYVTQVEAVKDWAETNIPF